MRVEGHLITFNVIKDVETEKYLGFLQSNLHAVYFSCMGRSRVSVHVQI